MPHALLTAVVALVLLLPAAASASDRPAFPLKVSENGHYLVDQNGKPFLVHGDSPWEALWRLTKAEWVEYLDRRAAQRFNSVLLNLLPDDRDTNPWTKTRDGLVPFKDPADFTTANADYFDRAEWFVNEAYKRGLMVLLFPCYLGFNHTWIDELRANGVEKAAAYGKLVAARFDKYPNIVWIMGGDLDPEFARAEHDALAESLFQHAPRQLLTFHGREHSSAVVYPDAKWLALNATYSYAETYTQSHEDWGRTPAKPTFMSESGYEREANDRRFGTPQRMRRQAYWTLLAGSAGHFYGTSYWSLKPGWREHLAWTGAQHMTHVRDFFEALPWTRLVPRFETSLILDGNGEYGSHEDFITAAATPDRRVAALYMPVARRVTLDMALFPGAVRARWFDPTTGRYADATSEPVPNSGRHVFWPPAREQDSDWALVLTADAPADATPPHADLRYYELRIHRALPGKTDGILERFRDKISALEKRHGLNPVACWVSRDAQQGDTVIELLHPAGPEAADRGWKGFYADPELKPADEASERKHGKTSAAIDTLKLVAPASAVRLDAPAAWPARVFDLRLYQRAAGREDDFKTRWREYEIRVYERHSIQSLGWWEAVDSEHRGVFVALLAHESAEAMARSVEWSHQDGGWQRIAKETERYGPLRTGVTSYAMTATDCSVVR